MARLTIEHDAVADEPTARTRRRSIALRLDGKAWLRVEPEAFVELEVADGDEIDDARRAAVEETLARARARLFVVRSLAVRMQSRAEIEKKLAARDVPPDVAREAIERAAGYGYIDDAGARRAARTRHAGARLRPPPRGAEAPVTRALGRRSPRLHSPRPTAAATTGGGNRPRGARSAGRRHRRRSKARDRLPRPPRLLGARGLEGRPAGRPRADAAGGRRVGSGDAAARSLRGQRGRDRRRVSRHAARASGRSSAAASPSSSISPIRPTHSTATTAGSTARGGSPIRFRTWARRRPAT